MKNRNLDRNDTIDILRVIFAYMVVIHHSGYIGLQYLPGGRFAVEFFFIMTGAFMNRSVMKNDQVGLWNFLKNKFGKLLPIFWFTSAVTLICKWACDFRGLRGMAADILTGLFDVLFLRMAGLADAYSVNPVAWYLSAMFLATLLLYPIARKYRKACAEWVFPLITIALCSYLVKTYGTVVTFSDSRYTFFMLDMVKRAIAEICFGFSLYELALQLGNIHFTRLGRLLLCSLEILGYAAAAAGALFALDVVYGPWLLLLLGASAAVTLSGWGCALRFRNRNAGRLAAEYSVSLYLSHYSALLVLDKVKDAAGLRDGKLLAVYLVSATVISIVNMAIVSRLKPLWPAVKRLIVQD